MAGMDAHTSVFDRLIAHFETQAELARRVSEAIGEPISYQAVHKWRTQIPANRCRMLEDLTGGAVSCYDMRPDIFPPPTAAAATRTARKPRQAQRVEPA